ncbi:MAG: HD domain-containing protein [Candidatus Obscuribacterales bacterium]|nr:HD domain-containing protein [Candidatus Obscuribacterales bacterium]
MNLAKAKELVAYIFAHPQVSEMAIKGDKLSSTQTDHGMTHFLEVTSIARKISTILNSRTSGFLSDWETEVVIPLASLLHDIGRAISVEDHANAGAKWSLKFLRKVTLPGDTETLPMDTVKRICRIIACHRSNIVLHRPFNDACHAVVVCADKFAGDEDRVRPGRAFVMGILTFLGLSHIKLRHDGIHDRVNFAIKNVELELRGSEFGPKLTIDPRVCEGRLILDTYSDRYLACHLAAKYLGLEFRLETVAKSVYGIFAKLRNAIGFGSATVTERYAYNQETQQWLIS